ncbi:Ku protein [Streptomyces sp. NPDC015032]|uniref:Ku protein n=1 Tax=Streptomyces sp. NPDC015032 TaxID=3364937 RepID=UPI0036F6261F
MLSTIWTGVTSFGLVTIPAQVPAAAEDHAVRFGQIHLADMGRIHARKICGFDGKPPGQEEIGRGYELARGRVIPVTDEELGGMPTPWVSDVFAITVLRVPFTTVLFLLRVQDANPYGMVRIIEIPEVAAILEVGDFSRSAYHGGFTVRECVAECPLQGDLCIRAFGRGDFRVGLVGDPVLPESDVGRLVGCAIPLEAGLQVQGPRGRVTMANHFTGYCGIS